MHVEVWKPNVLYLGPLVGDAFVSRYAPASRFEGNHLEGELGRSPAPRFPVHGDALGQLCTQQSHPVQDGFLIAHRTAKLGES